MVFPELQPSHFFLKYEGIDTSNFVLSINAVNIKKIQEKSKEFNIISVTNMKTFIVL